MCVSPNITSSLNDDKLLTRATELAYVNITSDWLFKLPSNWNIICCGKKLMYSDIRKRMLERGYSKSSVFKYYNGDGGVECDSPIIYLTVKDSSYGNVSSYPLFIGEIKKQGTNDRRVSEGKKKQAIGNAAPDRVAKNYEIFADFCYNCDCNFFPYNVFLHGCDFSDDEMTGTMRGKLSPFFGDLNVFNPYFDKDVRMSLKGGCCYYQEEDFTVEQLYDYVYKCCEEGIKYFLCKFVEEE